MAAVVCATFTVLDPNKWSKSDIDYIVMIGDKYYNGCITARDNLAPGEVSPKHLLRISDPGSPIEQLDSENKENNNTITIAVKKKTTKGTAALVAHLQMNA